MYKIYRKKKKFPKTIKQEQKFAVLFTKYLHPIITAMAFSWKQQFIFQLSSWTSTSQIIQYEYVAV